MKKSIKQRLTAFAAGCMTVALSMAAGCNWIQGSLKMDDFLVDESTIDKSYYVGDQVDFTSIGMSALFNDGSKETVKYEDVEFYFNGEKITDFNALTATAGSKEIEVRYEGDSVKFTITVAPKTGGGDQTPDDPVATGLTLNTSAVKKSYYVEEQVDFSGIVATVSYDEGEPETVAFDDLKFYFDDTEIATGYEPTYTDGTKTITVEYEGQTATFTITVADYYYASSYIAPDFVTTRKATLTNNLADFNAEDSNYESKFFTGYDTAHLVGDDNAFKFLPIMKLESEDPTAPDYTALAFYTETTVSMKVEDEYVTLIKTVDGETTKYAYEGTTYVVENNGKNEYDFADAAIGKEFKLSVLPSEGYLLNEEEFTSANAVAVEVKVVDAYNIYEAKDLAVMENVTDGTRTYNGVGYWDSIKQSKGITADVVNALQGVVLQGDIVVKAEDLPTLFTYSLGDYQLKYYYQSQGESALLTKDQLNALGLSTTFLRCDFPYGTTSSADTEEPVIFERYVPKGQTFNFYGNYYSIDASKMPLVASFDGSYNGVSTEAFSTACFSTASLLKFRGPHNLDTAMYDVGGTVNVTNVNAKGNANISDLLCAETNTNGTAQKGMPVYAGGIIFMKSDYNTLNMANVISRTFFINYFGYRNTLHNYTNVKAYDSYSNSVWARGATTINIEKSNIERAGGPLFILCDMTDDDDGIQEYGKVYVDADSKLESFVTGQEAWFISVGASGMAAQVASLDNLFGMMAQVVEGSGHPQATQLAAAMRAKTILQPVGTGSAAVEKMNLICATIKDGELLTGVSSGYFQYGNTVLDRRIDFVDATTPVSTYGVTMMQALASTIQSASVYGYALNITADTNKTFLLKPVDTSISPLGIYPYNLDGTQVTDPTWLISEEPAICLNLPTIGAILGYYTL